MSKRLPVFIDGKALSGFSASLTRQHPHTHTHTQQLQLYNTLANSHRRAGQGRRTHQRNATQRNARKEKTLLCNNSHTYSYIGYTRMHLDCFGTRGKGSRYSSLIHHEKRRLKTSHPIHPIRAHELDIPLSSNTITFNKILVYEYTTHILVVPASLFRCFIFFRFFFAPRLKIALARNIVPTYEYVYSV